MTEDTRNSQQWKMLVGDLLQICDKDQQLSAEVDDVLIARYLTGECDESEHKQIDRAIEQFPELAEHLHVLESSFSEMGIGESPVTEEADRDLVDNPWSSLVAAVEESPIDAEDSGNIDEELAVARCLEDECTDADWDRFEAVAEKNPAIREHVKVVQEALAAQNRPILTSPHRFLSRRLIFKALPENSWVN